ncbi:MAG TPA: NUDIX hydrolase [Rhizomicrobium sp.]|jgi:8-oxo-dGTP pyrophosphatase MutT (NUDIX family)
MTVASRRSVKSDIPSGVQYAALPYRVKDSATEILLVTSKHNRRWIVPKGWPIEGQLPQDSAAREALEEAGVSGDVESVALGFFHYFKTLKRNLIIPCKVDVFALRVTRCRKNWSESSARQRRWHSIDDAVAAVIEPQLRLLIRKFAARDRLSSARPKGSQNFG